VLKGRLKITFWPALLVLAVVVLTTRLGFWQLSRAHQREALNAHMLEYQHETPIPIDGKRLALASIEYHRVVARGRLMPERVVLLDNRPYQDQPGFYVVMPLELDGGGAVLVNRGWLPRNSEDRAQIGSFRTPAGEVEIVGVARANASEAFELGHGGSAPHTKIRQNLSVDDYASETGIPLQSFVIQQTSALDDGLVRDWPVQSADTERNYGYMVQWWAMAIAALGFGLYAARRAARPARKGAAKGRSVPGASPGPAEPTASGPAEPTASDDAVAPAKADPRSHSHDRD
jgi:surfeit locus 1 family protein